MKSDHLEEIEIKFKENTLRGKVAYEGQNGMIINLNKEDLDKLCISDEKSDENH